MFDYFPSTSSHTFKRTFSCLEFCSTSCELTVWQYKRSRKVSSDPIDAQKRSFLTALLQVILQKLKWDEEAEPDDVEDDDNAEFEKMRKVPPFFSLR